MRQLPLLMWCMVIGGCASDTAAPQTTLAPVDPLPGSGGRFFGTPSRPGSFKPEKFSAFQIAVTTKAQVAAALGKPEGWVTMADGGSQLEYAFGGATTRIGNQGARQIVYAFFTFDANKTLSKMQFPGHDEDR